MLTTKTRREQAKEWESVIIEFSYSCLASCLRGPNLSIFFSLLTTLCAHATIPTCPAEPHSGRSQPPVPRTRFHGLRFAVHASRFSLTTDYVPPPKRFVAQAGCLLTTAFPAAR